MNVDQGPVHPVIGWYIHHQGSGHLHRAMSMARALARAGWHVTGLSSLSRPAQWPGEWVRLERDDSSSEFCEAATPAETAAEASDGCRLDRDDVTAGGSLHYVPVGHSGLRRRSAQISAWIDSARPRLMVVDVSVEVTILARLHGIPVLTAVLPGSRGDYAHQLGFRLSSAILGFWPQSAEGIVSGIPEDSEHKFHALGGLSRFPTLEVSSDVPGDKRGPADDAFSIVVLNGAGGGALSDDLPHVLTQEFPAAEVTVLGGPNGTWVEDPWPIVRDAAVVVTAAGQNSIAEVAASRTPAVVIAHPRPYDEQNWMLEVLVRGPWPVIAGPDDSNAADWAQAIAEALRLDGSRWSTWCDGKTLERFSNLVLRYAADVCKGER